MHDIRLFKKSRNVAALVIKSFRFSSLAWLAAPLGAIAFFIWVSVVRMQHIEFVSAQGGWSEKQSVAPTVAATTASDLVAGNGLIIPEHLTESYHWIAQTQQMFNRGEWRVRHIDYENAPLGREVHLTSPYRWWLGLVAWSDHLISGRSPAQSLERAALVADPLLHFLFLLGTTFLVAWRFGALPAALISIGFVTLFPFAAEFLPGAPDDHGMAHLFALWSVLLLLGGVGATPVPNDSGKSIRRWFFFAGITGGLGLWLSVSGQVPVLAGIVAGALLAAWLARNHRAGDASATAILPWRTWAMGGAVAILGGYLIEFSPEHLADWRLAAIHPLYGLAWLGGGEVLAQTAEWIQGKKNPRTFRHVTVLALAVLAIAALPVALWKTHESVFFSPDIQSLRLTKLPNGPVAQNLGAWVMRDGATLPVLATLLPLLLVVPAVWLLIRRTTGLVTRVSMAMALGPVFVALGFASRYLVWWNEVDGLLLVLLAAATGVMQGATIRRNVRLAWSGLVLVLLAPAIFQLAPRATGKSDLSQSEVFGLVERDLASWLALRADPGGAVILAPPNESTTLCYYGAMRGIGSLSWENREGVAAAVRILSAPSAQEAKELIERREITHIVILSWDTYFDEYARAGTGQMEGSFLNDLRSWKLPLWLRPMAYQLPAIAGFEGQSVTLFEVVEDQNEAAALGRLVEYFIEMGELDKAASTAQALRRFPADFAAWVARAEVELARGDEAGFAVSLKLLQSRLATKNAPALPWDLRVGLGVVLAKAKQTTLAREQLRLCVESADEKKLRALTTGSLYRLIVLTRAFDLTFEPKLRVLALDLLPSEWRERLR